MQGKLIPSSLLRATAYANEKVPDCTHAVLDPLIIHYVVPLCL